MYKRKSVFLKRISCFIMAILMLPAISATASDDVKYTKFESYNESYGFEEGELSNLLSVQNATDGSTVTLTASPDSEKYGQAVRLHAESSGGYAYVMPYYGGAICKNPLRIGFDFYADAESASGEQFGIKLVIESTYVNLIHFTDGKVYHGSNSTNLTYEDKTRYNVQIELDAGARYVRFLMKKADESEWNKAVFTNVTSFSALTEKSKISQIRIGYHKRPSGGSTDFYIDNYFHYSDLNIKAPLYSYFEGFKEPCGFEDDECEAEDYVFTVNETGASYIDVVNFPEGIDDGALRLHHGGTDSDGNVYFMPYYNASGAGHPVLMNFDFYAADSLEMFVRLVLTNGQPLIFTFKNGTVYYGTSGGGREAVTYNESSLTYGEDAWYNVRIGVNWEDNHVNLRIKKDEEDTWTEIDMQDFSVLSSYSTENDSLSQIRIGYYTNPGAEADLYIDNYMHMTGGPGSTDVVGIYAGKPNVLVGGEATYISDDKSVVPFFKDGVLMLPAAFFADSIGALYEINDSVISINKEEKNITINTDSSVISENGIERVLTARPQISGENIYLPLCDLCDAFDYDLFCDASGLTFYTQKRVPFTWENDKKEILELAESFIYDDASGDEILTKIKEQTETTGDAHPRLIMTEDRFLEIRNEMAKSQSERDSVTDRIYTRVKATADSYLGLELPSYELDGIRLLDVSSDVASRVMNLAMMYNLTKETDAALADEYAEAARSNMLAAASFDDWNPYHFLDVATMSAGLAFGYDWLYDWMVEKGYTDDLATIRQAICDNAFTPVMNDYNGTSYRTSKYTNDGAARSYLWNSETSVNNWRFVVSGGLAVAALAISDELEGDNLDMAQKVLSQTLLDIRPAISKFAPNGAYSEGIGYWGYANQYYQYHLASLITATGTEFGYSDAPGLKDTVKFIRAMNGPASTFNYHDTSRSKSSIPAQTMAWAKYFDNPADALPRIDLILEYRGGIEDFLYYDKSFLDATQTEINEDSLFKEIGVFTTRSDSGKNAIWLGFHADDPIPGASHAHNDSGSFVLDAMGQNFFLDLGADDYNLENYSGGVYRTRAEGHNTFIINPAEEKYSDGTNSYYDQKYGGVATIDECRIKTRGAFAKSNLSDVYSADVTSAWRGVKLDNERRTVTVQDEIAMKTASEYYWFAHTMAEIEIDGANPKKAVLTLNGATLYAYIVTENETEDVAFSVMDALPLSTSPQVEGQNANDGIRKLTVHIENCENVNMAVVFTAAEEDALAYTSLAEWDIPDGDLPTEDIQAEVPVIVGDLLKASVTGLVLKGKTAVLIAALYKENKLVEVLKTSQTITNASGEDITLDLTNAVNDYDYIMAYVWDGTDGFYPISDKIRLPEN